MRIFYVLDADGNAQPAPDVETWADWYQTALEECQLGLEQIGEALVSTTFLGFDHGIGRGAPLLWETMIFGGASDGFQRRYTSAAAAREGHAEQVRRLTESTGFH